MAEIHIGFISNKATEEIIKTVLNDFPNIKGTYLDILSIESNPNELLNLKLEAILVGDSYLYDRVINTQIVDIPIVLIPIGTSAYYESMLNIHDHLNYRSLSIDSCYPNTQKALTKLKLSEAFSLSFIPLSAKDTSEIIRYHTGHHTKYNSVILTVCLEVHKVMVSHKIPCELVLPSHGDIVNSLERTLLATSSRIKRENQMAVCKLSKNISLCASQTARYTKELKNLAKSLQTIAYSVLCHDEIIASRGVIESYTQGYKCFPFLDSCEAEGIHGVHIGIGFANSIVKAHLNAGKALKLSSQRESSNCTIVREDHTVIGPLTPSSFVQEKFASRILDTSSLNIAQDIGISAVYLEKIVDRIQQSDIKTFSAQDLAELLEISLRSANRIILRATDVNLMRVVGEEKLSQKGRPRRIYELNL